MTDRSIKFRGAALSDLDGIADYTFQTFGALSLTRYLHDLKSCFTSISKHPEIGEVRGRGAMVAIELVKAGTKDPNPELMGKVIKYCQSKGVLILTAGSYGNVIRFLPPLVITDELLKDGLSVLAEAFDVVA